MCFSGFGGVGGELELLFWVFIPDGFNGAYHLDHQRELVEEPSVVLGTAFRLTPSVVNLEEICCCCFSYQNCFGNLKQVVFVSKKVKTRKTKEKR